MFHPQPAAAEPMHGYLQSGNVRLHYLAWGAPGRPPVVCLHGGAHTARVWDDLAARLADHWYVIALDQRGHGDSDWSPDGIYTRAVFAEDIRALLDALALPRTAFVTHSLGGNNALLFAAQHPERVTRLVLTDIGPTITPLPAARIAAIERPPVKDTPEAFIEEALARNPRRGRAFYDRVIRPNLRQLPDGRWTWKHDPRYRMASREQMSPEVQVERWRQLATVCVPVLLLHAQAGSVLTPEVVAGMAATLPDLRIVPIADAGHNVHLDQPEAFAAAVVPFLEEGL